MPLFWPSYWVYFDLTLKVFVMTKAVSNSEICFIITMLLGQISLNFALHGVSPHTIRVNDLFPFSRVDPDSNPAVKKKKPGSRSKPLKNIHTRYIFRPGRNFLVFTLPKTNPIPNAKFLLDICSVIISISEKKLYVFLQIIILRKYLLQIIALD